jgi:RNA polymerase sigma factor (sigma-70 family)
MTDDQLVARFVTRRDEAAFETLVRRHAPMVLGVCRRVLSNPQDAEDAFQATFLVLVRKASAIRQRELLGNWLYGVAYRTAKDARAAAIRRQARERQVSPMPEPEAREEAGVGRDLRPILDQELNLLPDKYRVPVVLCDLEGRTFRDVARQLGIPVGTLSGRLTTARGMLAKRLARHGLALSTGALATALAQGAASASVPSPLVASTVEAVLASGVGHGTAVLPSANVAALAQGVMKVMLLRSLKTVLALLVTAGLVIVAATVIVHAENDAKNTGAPKVLQLGDRGRRVAWSPDGKTLAIVTKVERTVLGIQYDRNGSAIRLWDVEKGEVRQTLAEDKEKGLAFQHVVFSPDGKTIAATASEHILKPNEILIRDVVKVWDAKTLALKRTLGTGSQLVCVALSPSGKLIATGDPTKKAVTLWNAETGAVERTLKTEESQPWSVAFSPDGKMLAVGGQKSDHSGEVTLWNAERGELKHTLTLGNYVMAVAFSPDGKQVACCDGGETVKLWRVEKVEEVISLKGDPRGHRTFAFSPDGKLMAAGGSDGKVRLWDVQTGELRETLEGHGSQIYSIAFSPDGKTLASASQDETVRLWPINRGAGRPR